jgi:hypothetical protein
VEYDRKVSPEQLRWYLDGTLNYTVNSSQMDATTWSNTVQHGVLHHSMEVHPVRAERPSLLAYRINIGILRAPESGVPTARLLGGLPLFEATSSSSRLCLAIRRNPSK